MDQLQRIETMSIYEYGSRKYFAQQPKRYNMVNDLGSIIYLFIDCVLMKERCVLFLYGSLVYF